MSHAQYGGADAPIRAAAALGVPASDVAVHSMAEFAVTVPNVYSVDMTVGVFVAHPRGIPNFTL
ncbi:MAG: hypothetical protein ACREQJ_17470 [Candidatus Binatia bacterium]